MDSLLPWILFSLTWGSAAQPSVTVDGLYRSQEKCHEAASHYHNFVGSTPFVQGDTTFRFFRKNDSFRSEMRCRQVDVDKLLAPYATDVSLR